MCPTTPAVKRVMEAQAGDTDTNREGGKYVYKTFLLYN